MSHYSKRQVRRLIRNKQFPKPGDFRSVLGGEAEIVREETLEQESIFQYDGKTKAVIDKLLFGSYDGNPRAFLEEFRDARNSYLEALARIQYLQEVYRRRVFPLEP